MQDTELIKRAEELLARCKTRNIITHSHFLTPAEQYALSALPHLRTQAYFFGGQDVTERSVAFFLPDYITEDTFDASDTISAFHLHCRFGAPGHRDILGSLLGLGIARWSVGDIYINGEDAWFFALTSVATLIQTELAKVGRNGVKVNEIPLLQAPTFTKHSEEMSITVSSTRLDAIIAGVFHLSRTSAVAQIEAGNVQLNHAVCEKISSVLTDGDVFSLRGYGKAVLREIGGKSRKDRLRITLDIYR